jgi:hypothetical protein
MCNICSNLDKCSHKECLLKEDKKNEDQIFELDQIFTEKSSKLKDQSENDNNIYHSHVIKESPLFISDNSHTFDRSEIQSEGSTFVNLILNKFEKIKRLLSNLLNINIQSLQYKTNVIKYLISNDFKVKNRKSKLKEVFQHLNRDINSKLIMSKTTADVRTALLQIDS